MAFRKALLAGVATACVLASGDAVASASLLNLSLTDTGTDPSGKLDPFYGKINPFYGKINPFYGKINPFYGKINPFWGDISPFWGRINPFYGKINPFYGDLDAFWGKIQPFATNPFWTTLGPYWQGAGPQWGDINIAWNDLQDSGATDYSGLQTQLRGFFSQANSFWGDRVRQYTGKDFNAGFADAMFAKYGIDINDANALASATPQMRSAFFLNFYDGLMSFTGVDHLDWWMPAINWSPALEQTAGGNGVTVGVLDATVTNGAGELSNVKFIGGYNMYVNDHGAAVASLIGAQHDGQGIMGIAPDSHINLYNPFDATGTAGWADVAKGIDALYRSGASVVNASLGVPGTVMSNEWVNILSGPLLSNRKHDLVIVKAAGNEGAVQTDNVPWLLGLEVPNNIILVGSTNPMGEISSFSNTPGEACLTLLGLCAEQNKLKYRFIVAPGELVLVSDNHGGVVRMSGTSFAAPLVTGAVALLQQRWPWLADHAEETAQIIFQSATDLGAPGVDPVYGWGMLNVEAAMSPLNWDKLTVYQPVNYTGKNVNTGLLGTGLLSNLSLVANWNARSLKQSVLNAGQLKLWQNNKAFVVAFENIGGTYRDFTIPLSSLLVGKSQSVNGASNPFQSYLYQRMIDWANGTQSLAFNTQSMRVDNGAWSLNMTSTEATPEEVTAGSGPFHSEFVASNRDAGIAMRLGEGNGAHAFYGNAGFSLRSDFDPATGGVNPILGFASGGAYAQGSMTVSEGLSLSMGFTQKSDDHLYFDPTLGPQQTMPLAPNKASAAVASIDYKMAEGFSLNASYTQLDEADALLGAQGGGIFNLNGGAQTGATTFGATAALGGGWDLTGSATMARTTMQSYGLSFLSLKDGKVDSMAYEFVAGKTGLFSELDRVRFSFAQPLHVESGALLYQSLQVINRETGEIGPVTQTWNIAGQREYRMEASYGTPIMDGRAEVEGFSLLDLNGPDRLQQGQTNSVSVGARFRMGF
jgi:hypothetical protein